jgi:hypothetical protein
MCEKIELDWFAIADLEPPEEEAISPNETTNENPTSPTPPPDVETRLIASLPNTGSVKNPGSVSTGYSLKYPEGEVEIDSPLYIDPPPVEQRCYKEMSYTGSLIRIKAPRQMGKSSLMTRILHQAEIQGDVTVCVNLQGINGERLSDSNKFLQWFCFYIGRLLKIPDKLNDYWNDELVEMMGGNLCRMAYFEEYLLPTINKPLTLALDEVDKVFEHQQTCKDFFGLLRMLHEEGKRRDIWKKLRLIIVHSTEVYVPLDINQSPFNVGLPEELSEFDSNQVKDLAQRHQLNWDEAEVNQLMGMVGGHPFLIRLALYHIARQDISLTQLQQTAPTPEGIYREHLHRQELLISEQPELAAAMQEVVTANNPVRLNSRTRFKLQGLGLVKLQKDEVTPRCELYRQYFQNN